MTSKKAQDKARLRPPPLQTSSLSQIPQDSTPTSPKPYSPSLERHPEVDVTGKADAQGAYLRFVLTDPVAFRYLEEDSSTKTIERRTDLTGFECYIVEQWTTSRMHPTFMITTYTGDPSHVVKVGVLSLPVDESTWSPRLRVYFKALNQYHARRRDTPLGILMVTNLAGFPSSLAVIPVPYGDVTRYRFDFFVNEDLKRLGCSGRVGLSLAQPAASTVAKFHQLYRTSEKNDIYKSVIELVKLCQSALTLFDKLEIDYADGLLCDVTERAISDWWVEIGNDYFNVEPHDGILGPTTVAGLLGLIMGARNRLHVVNAPVTKDPFDVEMMKRAINSFQKQQRMPRTRRLDRRTLERLHKLTQKAAEKERWAVPRAVKSTVAELSGKGGEMMMDVVGRRDKAGIAEIETADIDRFTQLVYGDRCKWLWLGKPLKKSKVSDGAERVPEEVQEAPSFSKELVFRSDEHGGFTWTAGRKSTVDGLPADRREQKQQYNDFVTATTRDDDEEQDEDTAKHSVFKRVGTIGHDAKSGLGKVGAAVGFRGHRPKPSVDDPAPVSPVDQKANGFRRPLLQRSHTSPLSSPGSPNDSVKDQTQLQMSATHDQSNRLNVVLNDASRATNDSTSSKNLSTTQVASQESLRPSTYATLNREHSYDSSAPQAGTGDESAGTADPSIAGSIYNGIDLNERLPTGPETEVDVSMSLRRTLSYSQFVTAELQPQNDSSFPRQLSFSVAEESVLTWDPLDESAYDPFASTRAQLAEQEYIGNEARHLRSLISALKYKTAPWTTAQLKQLHTLLHQADQDQETLDDLLLPHQETVRELQTHSGGMLKEERKRMEEGTKEIETYAAKLEYEINALKSKVDDVEAGVQEYEKGVKRVEDRISDLEKEGERGTAWSCVVQ